MSHLTRALALLVGLAALVATPPAVASYDGPTHSGPSHQHGTTTDSTVSTGHHQVRHIRRATARFHNIATAETAGYVLLKDLDGITCIDMPGLGGMGVHYVKPELIANPAIRAGSPEALVYAPDRDGTLRLAALEYLVDRAAWDAQHPRRPHLFRGHPFDLTPAPNRFGLDPFYSQHVWAWKANRAGLLAMWNPAVKCAWASGVTGTHVAWSHPWLAGKARAV